MNIPFLRQLALVAGVSFNIIGQSTISGYSAILLPQLRESKIYLDKHLESLLASCQNLGVIVGVLIVPMLMDKIGRKRTHLLSHIPLFIGWIVIILVDDARVMIAARTFQGISLGMRLPIAPIIVGECTSPKYRGAFIAATSLSIALGIFYVHLIGTFFNWKITGAAGMIFNILSFIILYLLPDSPTWFAKVGRNDDAYIAFQWYRGYDNESKCEFEKMLRNQEEEIKCGNNNMSILAKIKSKDFFKPFIITILLAICYILSGYYVITAYTVDILSDSIPKTISPYTVMLGMDILRIIAGAVGCVMMNAYNRRIVLHSCSFVTVLALTGISLCLFLDSFYHIKLSFILISSFFLLVIGVGSGLQSLSYVLLGEIFSVSLKALSSSLCSVLMGICGFFIIYAAPYIFATIGMAGTFAFYMICVLSSWLVLCFIMPETKDKSLVEIEEQMKGLLKVDRIFRDGDKTITLKTVFERKDELC